MTQPDENSRAVEVARRALGTEDAAAALRVITALQQAGMLREAEPVRSGAIGSGCALDDLD